jgi:hypothetical protein
MSTYTIYRADYNPVSSQPTSNPLQVSFDQGNDAITSTEIITANGKYQRIVHKSVDHLYYRDFISNNKASFGSGNINSQERWLEDQAYIISVPQSKFGEALMPESILISMSYTLAPVSGTYAGSFVAGVWGIEDDGLGNLVITGSSFYSPYGEFVGSSFFNYSSSVDKTLVGMWPQDDLYKYVNASYVNLTQSFNKGLWQMESLYNNVKASYLSGSGTGPLEEKDFLGAIWNFTSSLSSSIRIKPNVVKEYNQKYNFQNDNYSINMVVIPSQAPTHPSGSVLISKQGPVEDIRIDLNGNPYTYDIPNKSPYRLLHTSESLKVQFEKDTGIEKFILTSSIAVKVDELNHITLTRSGSLYSLYVWNALESSTDSGSATIADNLCANLSDIYVGNSYTGTQGFDGVIDNLKIFKDTLTLDNINVLRHTMGVGNLHIGNVFYNHGMMILTSIPAKFGEILSVTSRGTHTIWETEISCTVGPGEFGMSCNPTLQEYDPIYNDFVYRSFVTSSYFKPYVTSVGLYDDYGNLLAIGKLNTPIQTPNNVDTTFIVRFDR